MSETTYRLGLVGEQQQQQQHLINKTTISQTAGVLVIVCVSVCVECATHEHTRDDKGKRFCQLLLALWLIVVVVGAAAAS